MKTVAGVVMGTVHYMSPEQALGRDVDGRSDIFSLGVVLYELTTGRLPFLGGSPTETIERIANAQPEAIARFNYDVPAELERIIRRCLEKDPEERYQMAKDLLIELKHLKRDTESGAVAQPALPSGKRIPWPALALGAAVLAALAGGSLFLSGDSERIDSLAVLPFENGSADPEADLREIDVLAPAAALALPQRAHDRDRAEDPARVVEVGPAPARGRLARQPGDRGQAGERLRARPEGAVGVIAALVPEP